MVDLLHLCCNPAAIPRTTEALRALAASAKPGAPNPVVPYRLLHRLTKDQIDSLIERYKAGETAQVLADEFGVARSALIALFRKRAAVVRRGALNADQIGQLVSAYEAGKTVAALESETGIPHGTIQRALKGAGVTMRPRGYQAHSSSQMDYRPEACEVTDAR